MRTVSIDEIRYEVEKAGSNHLQVFGGSKLGGKEIQQHPLEISEAIHFLITCGMNFKNFLEVGVAAGGTTYILNHYLHFGKIVLLDNNTHSTAKLRPEILEGIKYIEFIGNSQSQTARKFVEKQNITFELIHIDADHSYNGVKTDTYNYIDLITPSGYIMFHDTKSCKGVEKWLNELIALDNIKEVFSTNHKHGIKIVQVT